MIKNLLVPLVLLFAAAAEAQTLPRDMPAPYILWTKAEAAAIKQRIDTQDWAKQAAGRDFPPVQAHVSQNCFQNLFRYQVLGDEAAGNAEKETLLSFIGTDVLQKDRSDWQWHHTDVYQQAIRFDILQDKLTPGQKRGVEETLRRFARFGIEGEPLRGFGSYGRHMGEHFAALALRDPRLIRGIFNSPGGMKAFFDTLLDGRFTRESLNEMHLLGQLLLWCRACEKLGLDQYGYGYIGKSGGSVRGLIEGFYRTGLPRLDLPSGPGYGMLNLPRLPMSSATAFPADILPRPLVDFPGKNPAYGWLAGGTSSGFAKDRSIARMNAALALELCHQRYPDAHLDYFLAQLRPAGSDRYYPSLYWGLDPIDPANTSPPPAPSGVYPEAQFVALHADDSPAFWSSSAPAVALTMARHHRGWTGDAMSIAAFYAYNRPLYHNPRASRPGSHWTPSGRSNSSVVVDNLQFDRKIEQTLWITYSRFPQPMERVASRGALYDVVKFAAFRCTPRDSEEPDRYQRLIKKRISLYPDADMERAVFLTREYLCDVFRVVSPRPRAYSWIVHPLGHPAPENAAAWKETTDLEALLGDPSKDNPTFTWANERALDPAAENWTVTALQTSQNPGQLGAAWFDRQVGVRVTMLGEAGTRVYTATPAEPPKTPRRKGKADPADDVSPLGSSVLGGFSLIAARRQVAETTFVAVHEPFEKNQRNLAQVRRIAQTPQAVAVAVIGTDDTKVNDRLLIKLGDDASAPVTLEDKSTGESFTFRDHAYIRITPQRVDLYGPISACKLRFTGTPELIANPAPDQGAIRKGIQSQNGLLIFEQPLDDGREKKIQKGE